MSNSHGRAAFALTGPDTRHSQVYINLGANERRDGEGFAPLGEVSGGMALVERFYALYGEVAGGDMRQGRQGPLETGGAACIAKTYPLLDVIVRAQVLPRQAS